MGTAIVFFSLDGNTRLAACGLAERLGADVFEIRTVKPYPAKGPLKILVGGKDATFDKCPAIQPLDIDLAAYDQVVLGTPVWADKVAAPINTFLKGRYNAVDIVEDVPFFYPVIGVIRHNLLKNMRNDIISKFNQ